MPTKDEIIAFLKSYGIENDNEIYRLLPACDSFSFPHPNTDSDCCEKDLMLPRKDMVIRLWSIINGFGTFDKDDWETFVDPDKDSPIRVVGEDKCICTHNIQALYFLRHIPTDIVLMIGCECIDKLDKRIRYKYKHCKLCNSDFPKGVKRNTKPYTSGYCSNECKVLGDKNKKLEKEKEKAKEKELRRLEYEKEIEIKINQLNPLQHKKLLLKDKIPEKKTMNNIHSNDNQYLSQSDAKKLLNYEQVDFGNLNVGDHFRYTSNKYQETGRKLAYGVVKSRDLDSIWVNGYCPNDEQPRFPDWRISHPDRNKKYNFYKKIKSYSQNGSEGEVE